MERASCPTSRWSRPGRPTTSGNLVFRLTARNFNPAAAMAGKVTIVEVEHIVGQGRARPDSIHLPGIYVHRIVHNANPVKHIEKRTLTETKTAAKATET
jgi:3-oxoacid CoA-transferase subunit A